MTLKSKGLTKFVIAKKDAQMLPSADPPAEKPVKGPAKEDPLKKCVLNLLDQGGRSEEEATAWCKDFLSMGGSDSEPESIDSANIREAERIMVAAKESLKPYYIEKCISTRQTLFGEQEYEATKRCRQDWEMGERVRGTAIATDTESRLSLIKPPTEFHRLEVLRLRLDSRIEDLMNGKYYQCTPEEADKQARKELGLPRVYPKKQPDVATVPEVFSKTMQERINESQAVNADKRPEEKFISPYSGVPNLYGKSRGQVVKEVFEQDAEDKNR